MHLHIWSSVTVPNLACFRATGFSAPVTTELWIGLPSSQNHHSMIQPAQFAIMTSGNNQIAYSYTLSFPFFLSLLLSFTFSLPLFPSICFALPLSLPPSLSLSLSVYVTHALSLSLSLSLLESSFHSYSAQQYSWKIQIIIVLSLLRPHLNPSPSILCSSHIYPTYKSPYVLKTQMLRSVQPWYLVMNKVSRHSPFVSHFKINKY